MEMGNNNPFKAPSAHVADVADDAGEFVEEGIRVDAGNGMEWLKSGWALFKEAPGAWILMTVVFIVMMIVLSVIPLVNLALNLLMPIFIGGILIGCKELEEGGELRVGHLFAGFSGYAGNLALVGLIYLVGVIAIGVVAALGLGGAMAGMAAGGMAPELTLGMLLPLLLALLLIIPLAMAVWYAPALVIFHEVPPLQAMTTSFKACIKNFVPFLIYGLVIGVLAIVASLPLFLGWLVLMPVLYASIYASYKDMFLRA